MVDTTWEAMEDFNQQYPEFELFVGEGGMLSTVLLGANTIGEGVERLW